MRWKPVTAIAAGPLACLFLFIVPAAGLVAAEHRLTGEYSARLKVGRGDDVRVVYASTVREGGLLSLGAGSSLIMSGSEQNPSEGQCKLMVNGMLDLMGSADKPVQVKGVCSSRIVVGNAEGRDDLRPKPKMIHIRVGRAVFRNVGLVVRNGVVNIEESVFINSPIFIDGGRVTMQRCSLLNPQGSALEVVRSDTYPVVQAKYLEIRGSTVGLRISKQTVRDRRMPLVVIDSNFADNSAHLAYDETQPLVIRGCYFDGLKATEIAGQIEYSDKPDRKGRIIPQIVRSKPVKHAGASLVKDGVVELKAPDEQNEQDEDAAKDESPVEPGG